MKKLHKRMMPWVAVSISIGVMALWAQSIQQPIRYNHKKHIEDVGLECTECHVNVETHARASIPNIEICGECHDDLDVENPEDRKVAEYVTKGEKIPWAQVHQVRDYAFFSHRRHVVLAEIECMECHGDVAQKEKPFDAPYVQIKMAWCLDCHEQRAVTTDCYACHR